MNPFRELTKDDAKIMETFAAGRRTLFAIKARGKAVEDFGFFDITSQKISSDQFGIMLWKEAHVAEKFILDHGWSATSEVFEIRIDTLWKIVQRVFGVSEDASAKYVLY